MYRKMQYIYIWLGLTGFFSILFMVMMIGLIIISKKTHAIIELKSSFSGTPIALFFQDNRYSEWKNTKPDSGLIEDKEHGTFVIDSSYIDKKTNNVFIPFNSSYAPSLNVKAVKMTDDLTYIFKEQKYRALLKKSIMDGKLQENEGLKTLRTSINFSTIKHFVSPILPNNIKSKIAMDIFLRLNQIGGAQFQNLALLIVSAIGAIILGGLIMRMVL